MTDALKRAREHEPRLYARENGSISSDAQGNYTVAFLGCICGWNRFGDAGESWAEHFAPLLDAWAQEARLEEAKWWRNYFPADAKQYDVRIAAL